MLNLTNIIIKNGIAEADYYCEGESPVSHIRVNVSTGEIIELQEAENSWEMYSSHAATTLLKMAKEHITDTERLVMWYLFMMEYG